MSADRKRQEQIKKLVRSSYENPNVIARYTDLGLWPAEESLILEFFPDEGGVLDMGCGAGRTTIPLAEMGLDVVGVDLSPAMIELANELAELSGLTIDFRVMDVTNLQFADCSFEVAFYPYNGIELVPGLAGKRQTLSEVWRVLSPGGSFIFSSHSLFAFNRFAPYRFISFLKLCAGRFAGMPVRERELGERFADEDEEVKYLQVLPPHRILRMLRQAGFEVLLFNTRKRLETGKVYRSHAVFEDGERFYVARKVE